MTTLLLVRHGETYDNAKGIMQGRMPGALNENGVSQARKVRDEMKDADIDVFLSSDLKRASDTCRIIAEPHGMEVVQTRLLQERDWGGLTGKPVPDRNDFVWPENIEPVRHLKERAKNFLDFVRGTYPGKTVLAVGHGIINRAIQSVLFQKRMQDIKGMENAEVRVLKL